MQESYRLDLKAAFELIERTLDHGTLDPDSRIDLRAAYDRLGAIMLLEGLA